MIAHWQAKDGVVISMLLCTCMYEPCHVQQGSFITPPIRALYIMFVRPYIVHVHMLDKLWRSKGRVLRSPHFRNILLGSPDVLYYLTICSLED